MDFLFDSFAWLVFFKKEGGYMKVAAILKDPRHNIFTTAANLYEVYYRLAQDCGHSALEIALPFIKTKSQVIPIDAGLAESAGEIRLKYGLSAIDSFTYSAAQNIDASVVTGDKDFSKLKNVILI
jgi:predicted nucleic acid-binding protein